MNPEDIKKLGEEWKRLNAEYDSNIQEIFDNPTIATQDEINNLKNMQQKLFSLETKLLEFIQK